MNGNTMSEQMTSRDIEDVLVSIRRLVTEDLRPASRDTNMAESGKLLLTPAHRVIPEPAGARPVLAAAPPPAEQRVDLLLAALGRAVKDRAPDWESETGDPSPLRLETPVLPVARPAAPHHAGRIRFVAPAAEQLVDPEPPADPTAFLDEDDVAAFRHDAAATAPAWAQVEPPAPEAAPDDVPPTIADAEDKPAPARDGAWSDAAEAAARAELEGMSGPAPMQDHDYDDFEDADPAPLDEAKLRDIVRAVLREELAGPLGERITRNIRKLVHQEIARAMALRNLD